jgi:predicted RNA binding protein YcfA (HicA-like mRNA interferase family)
VSTWGSAKARLVLAALQRLGWTVKRQSRSHRTLARDGWPDYVFAFHLTATK